jgi:tRNA N6-adenosine threonylcarbamoyltransferase
VLLRDHLPDICAAFQEAIVDMLVDPLERSMNALSISNIGLVGGVSANLRLRDRLAGIAAHHNGVFSIPGMQYSMDNAAMIAMSGFDKFSRGEFSSLTLSAQPALVIS